MKHQLLTAATKQIIYFEIIIKMDICQFPYKKVHAAIIVEGLGASLLFCFEIFVLIRAFLYKASINLLIILGLLTTQTLMTVTDIFFRNLNYKQCVEDFSDEQIWQTVKTSQAISTMSSLSFCLAYWVFASGYWATAVRAP